MANFICVTCGVQYQETDLPPEHCLICEDDRAIYWSQGAIVDDHPGRCRRIITIELRKRGTQSSLALAQFQASPLVSARYWCKPTRECVMGLSQPAG